MAAEYRVKVPLQQSDLPATPVRNVGTCTAAVMKWFSAEISGEYTCLITGITCVSGAIVASDNENKCLKRFRKGKFIDKLDLTDPCGICSLGNTSEVAVTEPDIRQITFCSVDDDISVTSTTKTQKKYECIAALDELRLIVGCCEVGESSVDVIDSNGNVLRSIQSTVDGRRLFRNPAAIACLNSTDVLISDPGTSLLLCLSLDGKIKFRYDSKGRPSGVCVDQEGGIYVGQYDCNAVFRLSRDGGHEGVVVDHGFNIQKPLAMAVEGRHLVLTEEMPSDRILVIKLPPPVTERTATGVSLANVDLNIHQSEQPPDLK